jgi:threonine dehydrogenase-like Zn-dependent dehydrogenase
MIEAVIREPGHVEVNDRPYACRPAGGEAVVEVRCLSLCGSDYKLFEGSYGGPRVYPICFGHEWSGVVVRAAAGGRIPRGTEVTGDCSVWCGRCAMCRRDKNLCRRIEKFGITTQGFSRQFRPVAERFLYPNGFGLGFSELALTEPCAVVVHGVARVAAVLRRARSVVIAGAGVLGVLTHLVVRQVYGVDEVVFLEPEPGRREVVRRIVAGARFLEPPDRESVGSLTYRELSDLAVADVGFECSGTAEGLNALLALVRPLGTALTFGLGRPGPVNTNLLVLKGLRLAGSVGGTGCFPEAMEFLAANRQAARALVTHRARIERAQAVFESTAHDAGRLKVQMEY